MEGRDQGESTTNRLKSKSEAPTALATWHRKAAWRGGHSSGACGYRGHYMLIDAWINAGTLRHRRAQKRLL